MNIIPQFDKRRKIILTSMLLTIGLLSTQIVDFNLRFHFIGGLAVLAYILSLWSLWQGLTWTKAIVLLILPTFFTVAVASFYFLLPVRWLTRLPVAFVFGLTFYLLLLAQNVFNVASLRTIPLYRAASTTSFLFCLLSLLFIYNVIYSLNLLFLWNGLIVALISFPLILQVLWSIKMEEKITLTLVVQSLVLSLITGEVGLALSFWPVMNPVVWSMAVATTLYVALGSLVDYLHGRLRYVSFADYLFIGLLIFIVSYLLTAWGGSSGVTVFLITGILLVMILLYVFFIRRNISGKLISNNISL